MRLTDLNPEWLHGGGEGIGYRPPGTNGEADIDNIPRYTAGVEFDCPCGCGKRRSIPFRNPPEEGIPGRPSEGGWQRTGTTFEDLTLSPSIFAKRDKLRPENCGWHGYVTAGEVTGQIDL
jgi:hypothetical protein